MATIKKVTDCPAGGFVAVQHKLLGEEEIKRDACNMLLAKFKFHHPDLKETVDGIAKGLKPVQALKDVDKGEPEEDGEPCVAAEPDAEEGILK